jgi:hypothetical protein
MVLLSNTGRTISGIPERSYPCISLIPGPAIDIRLKFQLDGIQTFGDPNECPVPQPGPPWPTKRTKI